MLAVTYYYLSSGLPLSNCFTTGNMTWITKKIKVGSSPAVQWLGLRASPAGGLRSVPGWGTKFVQDS